jgi:hypothetical protein
MIWWSSKGTLVWTFIEEGVEGFGNDPSSLLWWPYIEI